MAAWADVVRQSWQVVDEHFRLALILSSKIMPATWEHTSIIHPGVYVNHRLYWTLGVHSTHILFPALTRLSLHFKVALLTQSHAHTLPVILSLKVPCGFSRDVAGNT